MAPPIFIHPLSPGHVCFQNWCRCSTAHFNIYLVEGEALNHNSSLRILPDS